MKFTKHILALLMITALLSACGSDDNAATPDTTPEPFTFIDQTDVALNTSIESSPVTVAGINADAAISVSGGEYSIDGGIFTASAGTISNGQQVVVNQISSAAEAVTSNAILNIGGVSDTFSVTTFATDITPDTFIFTSQSNVAINVPVTSNEITVSGINTEVAISITGGTYSINGGVFTSTAGTIVNGQNVTVKNISSTSPATTTDAILTVGAVNNTFSVTTIPAESVAPTMAIHFPPQKSLTEGASIKVRGTASDNSGILSISVNGVLAESSDDFVTWTATVPNLAEGSNVLVATVTDKQNNISTDSVDIRKAPLADEITHLTLNSSNNRFLVMENNQLVEVDRATGLATRVDIDDGVTNFKSANDMQLDSNSNRLIVIDNQDDVSTIKEVNLLTGVKTIFSQDALAAPVGSFSSQLYELALDELNNRLFIADGTNGVIEVDLATSERTTLSSDNLYTVILDAPSNRLIGTQYGSTLVAIDIDTGVSTRLGSAGMSSVYAIAYDGVNDRVYAAGANADKIVQVNLVDDTISTVSDNIDYTGDANFNSIFGIQYDSINSRLIVSNGTLVLGVDISTGVRTTLASSPGSKFGIFYDSGNSLVYSINRGQDLTVFDLANAGASRIISDNTIATATSNISFGDIWGLKVDVSAGLAYTTDWTSASVIQIDLNTGARTVIADNSVPDAANTFISPSAFVWDEAGNRMLVLDRGRRSLIEVNYDDGSRRVISSPRLPNDNNVIYNPAGIKLDLVNNRVLVLESQSYANTTIFAIDLTTGERTIVTSVPTSSNAYYGFDVDLANSRVLLTNRNGLTELSFTGTSQLVVGGNYSDVILDDVSANAFALKIDTYDRSREIVGISLSTAVVTAVPTSVTPDASELMDNPVDIVMDEANNRAFVLDEFRAAILSVDLDTGARSLFADNVIASAQSNVSFTSPKGIALDSAGGRLLVTDTQKIIAISLATQARTLITDNTMATVESTIDLVSNYGITVDSINNRALIIELSPRAIIAVNLTSGARTVFTDSNTAVAESTVELSEMLYLVIDAANNRVIVSNSSPTDTIVAVDLDTGARTVLSDNSSPGGNSFTYSIPRGITLDSANNRVIVQDWFYNSLTSADLTDGTRTTVPSSNSNNVFTFGTAGIAHDTEHNRALIVEKDRDAIIAVDLITGEKVVLSQ